MEVLNFFFFESLKSVLLKNQTKPKNNGLMNIPIQTLVEYLTVKECTHLMVLSRPLLQRFRPIFDHLGRNNQIWQRLFHERIAREAPWLELRLIERAGLLREPQTPVIQNKNLAIQSILFEASSLLSKEQCDSLSALFNSCMCLQDLENTKTGLRTLTVCKTTQPEKLLKDYPSLVKNLSFVNAKEFSHSVTHLNEIYHYRSLIKRRVGDHNLQRTVTFTPSDTAVKRAQKQETWQELRKARSGISKTLENDRAYQNWLRAEALVATRAEEKLPVTLGWLDSIHGVLSEGLPNNGHPAGCCRPSNIEMYSLSKRRFIKGVYVPGEMAAFIEWLTNRFNLHDDKHNHTRHIPWIILTAAQASQWLVSIHPFGDGNGRISRLVMDYVLQRYGILPPLLSEWITPIWGEGPNVDADHAFTLVWNGVEKSYRLLEDNMPTICKISNESTVIGLPRALLLNYSCLYHDEMHKIKLEWNNTQKTYALVPYNDATTTHMQFACSKPTELTISTQNLTFTLVWNAFGSDYRLSMERPIMIPTMTRTTPRMTKRQRQT